VIRAVIFDFFGVVVGRGFNETYRYAGGDPIKDKQFLSDLLDRTSLGLITPADFRRAITKKIGISLERYEKAMQEAERPNDELLDYIERLKHNYKIAVLSNANLGSLERKLGHDRLNKYFDERIISAEVGMIKPTAEIYLMTSKKLGVLPEECIFIDDKKTHCEGAQAVGMQAVWYQNFPQMKNELETLLKP